MALEFGKPTEPRDVTERRVRLSARALPRNNLGNPFGHVSARLNDREFLVCASRALATIAPGESGTVVPIDGPLPDGVLGEVRVHQAIYRRRPAVGGIVRTFLTDVMTLSAMGLTPKVRHGFGSYFAPQAPIWMETALLRDDALAARVAETMGDGRAVVLRGNGCVLAGASIEEATVMAYFLESAARVELAVLAAGDRVEDLEYTPEEAAARAVTSGGIFERMWDHLIWGDPEA